jgi:hypothetical protein
LRSFRIYIISSLTAILGYCVLTVLTSIYFDLDKTVTVTIIKYSGVFFSVKTVVFFLPYLLLDKSLTSGADKSKLYLRIFSPSLLFGLYYLFIGLGKIYSLRNDFTLSFINYFPHFLIQIVTTVIVCALTAVYVNNRLRVQRQI